MNQKVSRDQLRMETTSSFFYYEPYGSKEAADKQYSYRLVRTKVDIK